MRWYPQASTGTTPMPRLVRVLTRSSIGHRVYDLSSNWSSDASGKGEGSKYFHGNQHRTKPTFASTRVSARAATALPATVPGSTSPRRPISCSSASSRIFPSGRLTDNRWGMIIDLGGVIPLYLHGSSRFIPNENLLVRSNKDTDKMVSCGKSLQSRG